MKDSFRNEAKNSKKELALFCTFLSYFEAWQTQFMYVNIWYFSSEIFHTKLPSIAAFTGLTTRHTKSPGASKYKFKEKKLSKMNFKYSLVFLQVNVMHLSMLCPWGGRPGYRSGLDFLKIKLS